MLEHHHPGLGDAPGMAVQAGELERCFVGFQAGVAEEGVGHACPLYQLAGHGVL